MSKPQGSVIIVIVLAIACHAPADGLGGETRLGSLADFPPAFSPGSPSSVASTEEALGNGYRAGLGAGIVSAGRFGFLKGDGLLDCSYPVFGLIEKTHLTEHPANAARRKWAISFDPPGAAGEGAAKRCPYYHRDQKGQVRANWISVVWDSRFTASEDFHGRKRDSQINYRVTYSIASPGILIETDDNAIRFGLTETPGYKGIVFPLKKGVTLRELSEARSAYDAKEDGGLADNWIMLWGSKAFPDVPLVLVLKENPSRIAPSFTGGNLTSLDLVYRSKVGYVIAATPFGLGALQPEETGDTRLMKKWIQLARFWSKALLAFPVNCKESYKVDSQGKTVSILQEYEYRPLSDAWNSRPVQTAPYPPALGVAEKTCRDIQLTADAVDLEFATKYGPLKAVIGSNRSAYTLPIPPMAARIPLAPAEDTPARREIRDRHRIAPHDPSKPLPRELFPGHWSRPDRAATTSMAGEWAFIWPWLDAESRQALRRNMREFLVDALDDQSLFQVTALYQSIQKTPRDAGKLTRPLWFERTEPYTGKKYLVSYTIPNVRKEGKSVTDYKGCFTDLDWGNGRALTNIYQMARLSGAWDVVRKDWSVVKGAYGLFEMLQDWACMSASGCECGHGWTDTSCYGGYIAFRELARSSGDADAWQEGIYLHAKHAAMRLAMFNNGTFIAQYYGAKPWKVQHSFPEMAREYKPTYEPVRFGGPLIFQPDELRGDDLVIQRWSFYSLVAEGTGWECPDMLFTLQPEATSEFVRLYNKLYPEWRTEAFCKALNDRHSPSGGITLYEMLLFELRDPAIATATIRRQFDEVQKADLIRRYLKPSNRRNIAANEYVLALLETRDDPAWLEDWEGCDIDSAEYDRPSRRVRLAVRAPAACRLQFGGRKPKRVELEGRVLSQNAGSNTSGWDYDGGRLIVRLPRGGPLVIGY